MLKTMVSTVQTCRQYPHLYILLPTHDKTNHNNSNSSELGEYLILSNSRRFLRPSTALLYYFIRMVSVSCTIHLSFPTDTSGTVSSQRCTQGSRGKWEVSGGKREASGGKREASGRQMGAGGGNRYE